MSNSRKVLGTFDATSMVAGNMIGSGIFLMVGAAAMPITNDFSLILAWIGGGLMALMGAFCIAELSTRFPQTGGDFLYLHKVYGPFPSFLYGWMGLVIFQTGSIAILALYSAEYAKKFFPLPESLSDPGLASLIVVILSAIHCYRVEVGSRFQSILTVIKILGIFFMIAILILYNPIEIIPLVDTSLVPADSSSSINTRLVSPFIGFSRALTPIFFAYTGWNVAGYIGGEISNPRKTLPIALIGGTLITMIIYAIVNYSFLHAIGLEKMKVVEDVPLSALEAVGASYWTKFIALLIFISVTSSLSITIQTAGARIIQAMGKQGVFFRFTGKINSRFHTPVNALIILSIWAIVLMFLFKDMNRLVDSTTIVMIMFSALSISTLFKVDRSNDSDSVYKVPFFPFIPLAYILSAFFICWGVIQYYLSKDSYLPFWGFSFLAVGTIVYFVWKKLF